MSDDNRVSDKEYESEKEFYEVLNQKSPKDAIDRIRHGSTEDFKNVVLKRTMVFLANNVRLTAKNSAVLYDFIKHVCVRGLGTDVNVISIAQTLTIALLEQWDRVSELAKTIKDAAIAAGKKVVDATLYAINGLVRNVSDAISTVMSALGGMLSDFWEWLKAWFN